MKKRLSLLVLMLAFLVIAGCSVKFVDLNPSITETGLLLSLTDKPGDNDILKVNIAITKVELVPTEGEVIEFKTFDEPLQVDLLTLRFAEEILGESQIPAGSYQQIRLVLEDSSTVTVLAGDLEQEFALKIPSADKTGLKIPHNFIIEEGTLTELMMDVDVREFIHQRGQGDYQMRSTAIRVIDKDDSGAVTGQVVDQNGTAIADRDVYVGAYTADGTKVGETLALREDVVEGGNTIPAGSFVIKGLPEGSYTLGILPNNDGDVSDDQYIDKGTFIITAEETFMYEEPIVIEIPYTN